MNDGNQFEPTLDTMQAEEIAPHLREYVKWLWLLSDPFTLEVWGLLEAKLARVECVADESQSLELDSGDWLLVRVSRLPTIPDEVLPTTSPSVKGIVRFQRVVGKED
ncbi:MAG: hypothetical protein HY740_07585 [Chloroflexi bacterium]|nr:hypothetical protein [Chloroflexota bacterium]